MGAPDSAPVSDTLAGSTVDVSLELTAPTDYGSYSGYFTLKNAEGESIDVGTEKTFWLKIIVGDGTAAPTSTSGGTPRGTSGGTTSDTNANCNFSENSAYITQMGVLINNERQKNSLPEFV